MDCKIDINRRWTYVEVNIEKREKLLELRQEVEHVARSD